MFPTMLRWPDSAGTSLRWSPRWTPSAPLGSRATARRARQRLPELRGRNPDARRKATIADSYGLRPRERDVLELIAAGHSDAEIGAALFISPKTAIGAILSKLGVRNRRQAAYVTQTIREE